jgi:DNA-binding Xre family transcriptional regulator
MVRLRLAQLLKQRKMTAYRLAKTTGLSLPTVYKLTKPSGEFTRLEADTIDKLCAALACKIADLLVRVPDKAR